MVTMAAGTMATVTMTEVTMATASLPHTRRILCSNYDGRIHEDNNYDNSNHDTVPYLTPGRPRVGGVEDLVDLVRHEDPTDEQVHGGQAGQADGGRRLLPPPGAHQDYQQVT